MTPKQRRKWKYKIHSHGKEKYCSGEITRLASPPTNAARGSNPGACAIRGTSKLLVLSFALRDFSLGTTVSSLLKNQHFHTDSNSIRNRVNEEPLSGCATSESLFIYLFYLFIT